MVIRSTSLRSQAPSSQSRPGFAKTDSTGASLNSPRTPTTTNWPSQHSISMKQTAKQDNKLPPISMLEDGQCAGSQGQVDIGSLASILHTGPKLRHASRRSSESPLGGDLVSPTSTWMQPVPEKTFGIRDILNPLETRLLASGCNGPVHPAARPSDHTVSIQTPGPFLGPFTGAQSLQPGQAASTSCTGTPLKSMTPLGAPGSGRNPPIESFSLPISSNTMQEASPTQYDRATNTSHDPFRVSDSKQTSLAFGIPTAKLPLPSHAPPNDSVLPWSETLQRHGAGGPPFSVEGQHAFMTLPSRNEFISVHVDVSHGSKKADEKRQKNAQASTRYRRKRKIMLEENDKQLQELRDGIRTLESINDELTQQLDFYREDCNRLRDIVAQTASMSGLAAGPPCPTISISNFYTETGPVAKGPPGSIGYGGEELLCESLAKRPRTQ
ncbi:hypothetical protein FPOA_12026 [Fusarium poae]|uniref:BZIP domain-containing protein n=2 Tax=Fusarium poae TaxID=36050 RepID=A0A1B8AAM9_FUSPO|nr:hypothetical protein FPOA_12026 [Fusarium poae]